jgi:hypothetical protein
VGLSRSYSGAPPYPFFHSDPQTVRIDKGLECFIRVRFRHYIGGIILTIDLSNFEYFSVLVRFTNCHNIDYKAFFFNNSEFDEALVKRIRIGINDD